MQCSRTKTVLSIQCCTNFILLHCLQLLLIRICCQIEVVVVVVVIIDTKLMLKRIYCFWEFVVVTNQEKILIICNHLLSQNGLSYLLESIFIETISSRRY